MPVNDNAPFYEAIKKLYRSCGNPKSVHETFKAFKVALKTQLSKSRGNYGYFNPTNEWFANEINDRCGKWFAQFHPVKQNKDNEIYDLNDRTLRAITNAINAISGDVVVEVASDRLFSVAVLMTIVTKKHDRGNGFSKATADFLDTVTCHVVKRTFSVIGIVED